MTPSDAKATLSFSDGSPSMEMPIYKGTIGPDVIDIRKLYGQTGKSPTTRGSLHGGMQLDLTSSTATRASCSTAVPDRARRHPVRLPRDLLPAAQRGAAERDREG